jgi:ligand-binding sensor domain-containing protein
LATVAAIAWATQMEKNAAGGFWNGADGDRLPSVVASAEPLHLAFQSLSNPNQIFDLALSTESVWAATGGGLVQWSAEGTPTYYGAEHGLASNRTRTIFAANDGSLWVGTLDSGLSHLQEGSWRTYNQADGLASNEITRLIEFDNQLYVGHARGVDRLAGERFEPVNFAAPNTPLQVFDLAIDPNTRQLWAVTSVGIYQYDGAVFTLFASPEVWGNVLPASIAFDLDGRLWVGTQGNGVVYFEDGSWTFGAASPRNTGWVYKIRLDPVGNVWFATSEGLWKYAGDWELFGEDVLPSKDTRAMVVFPGAGLWFGTQDGLVKFSDDAWTPLVIKNTLQANLIQALGQTSNGQVWAGTQNRGVARFDGRNWQHYTQAEGLPGQNIPALAVQPNDTVWVGTTSAGTAFFDGTRWQTVGIAEGMTNPQIFSIFALSNEQVFIGTGSSGFFAYEKGKLELVENRLNGNIWGAVVQNNELVAANFLGELLQSPDGARVWQALANTAENADLEISLLQAQDDTLWVGTAGQGVIHRTASGDQTYSTSDGLPGNVIWAIAQDAQGNLWVGTDNGLAKFNGTNWQTYGTADGLAAPEVRALMLAKDGRLWAATAGGISVIRTQELP